ncbi:MAG: hypothetical protein WKF62_03960 [Solirubrobacterales bacterium]
MRSGAWGRAIVVVVLGALALPAYSAGKAPDAAEGWAQRALDIQYDLASDVGWTNMPWVGTHNSYNSDEQTGISISSRDPNQVITNVAQLDAGVRSLELDIHRFPDVPGAEGPLRVCHARGADQGHLGCSTDKELAPTLAEIVAWLDEPKNSEEVLLLYLEDHMGDAAGYNAAAGIVDAQLGNRLYRPPASGGCSEVPGGLTRDAIRADGAQALIVSDCGPEGATGWHSVAHNWNSHVESRPVEYEDFPRCGPDYKIPTYESRVVRYYEDSTALSNQFGPPTGLATADDGITPPTAAAMARCGVDLIGLDQVSGPADPRFEALVWSWQVNRPRPGMKGERDCAVQRRGVEIAPAFAFPGSAEPPTRAAWFDQRCVRLQAAACRDGSGEWTILEKRVRQRAARNACEKQGLALGTPRTGFESQRLDAALTSAETRQAWLGTRRAGGTWNAPDPPLAFTPAP